MLNTKFLAAAILAAAIALSTGCSPQPSHPNQINTFDGASYDSLTAAHAALSSLRPTIATTYPQYKAAFNQAAAAYTTAFNAYALFRGAPANQSAAALAISGLTVAIVSLEDSFQADMHVQPSVVKRVRGHAAILRTSSKITISDILTELEIAAAIAAGVPGTQPYATIAQIVIEATQAALQTFNAGSGQLIDLSTLTPIAPIA